MQFYACTQVLTFWTNLLSSSSGYLQTKLQNITPQKPYLNAHHGENLKSHTSEAFKCGQVTRWGWNPQTQY
jgi:hypothetical protein